MIHQDCKKNTKWFLLLTAILALNLLEGNFPISRAHAGQTDVLLLSCMDYRLVDDTEKYMSSRGLQDKYDHIVLAGASLGALTDQYPAWNKTFWEHLDIAIQLHHIQAVIVLDHRDCGAYKVILGEEHAKSADIETAAHADKLRKLKDEILKKYPNLKVEMLLMSLDGKVESIS